MQGVISALDVIEVDEKYLGLARHLLSNVIIAENEEVLQNSNGFVVIEQTGRYVKGKYSLTGGMVGLFEGKKIGRAKNLEKLQEEIIAQHAVVELLKEEIQERHNEVIAFNEDLREHALKNTEIEIQELTNKVFSLHNKLENLHALQGQGQQRLEDLKSEIQQTQGSVEATRNDLKWLSEELILQAAKVNEGEEIFKNEEA